jgi:sRNA-binding protein
LQKFLEEEKAEEKRRRVERKRLEREAAKARRKLEKLEQRTAASSTTGENTVITDSENIRMELREKTK